MKFITLLLLFFGTLSLHAGDLTSVHPRPKASYLKTGTFLLDSATTLIVPSTVTSTTAQAIDFLMKELKTRFGVSLIPKTINEYTGEKAIVIGEWNSTPLLTAILRKITPPGEVPPRAQGYVLDVTQSLVLLAGIDSNGTFNSVSTFIQLLNPNRRVAAVHILDYPDFPIRWIYAQHYSRNGQLLGDLKRLTDSMKYYKINGIVHADFGYDLLATSLPWHLDSIATFTQTAARNNVQIIPQVVNVGWSSGWLNRAPNYAAGVPTSGIYIVEADTGRLIPDPQVALPNGNFENALNGKFPGWSFYDGPEISIFADSMVAHSGRYSARCENFAAGSSAGNARFNRQMDCKPFSYFTLSAWVRTEAFSGDEVRLLAIGNTPDGNGGAVSRVLTFTNLDIPATTNTSQNNGWIKVEVRLNTLTSTKLLLYCGVWGGRSGKIWFDDFQVQPAGLCNILRRPGAPLVVTNSSTQKLYTESIDYAPLHDDVMEASRGNYGRYHTPPTLSRLAIGAIKNGDTLILSYFHPLTTISDNSCNGSTMVSLTEDSVLSMMNDQAQRINQLLKTDKFFLSYDEIRMMNWDDPGKVSRHSAQEYLGAHIRRMDSTYKSIHPSAQTIIWNDMIDSLHNAVNDYYLVNGDLRGIWDSISTSMIIANWNGGNLDKSMNFFSKRGFQQIVCPYYDAENSAGIRSQRIASNTIPGILGAMYTTWGQDYRFVPDFADYQWSAGPFVIHTPLDTSTLAQSNLQFTASVYADNHDASDVITSVQAEISDSLGHLLQTVVMNTTTPSQFDASIINAYPSGFTYRIIAKNFQGFTRSTPNYDVWKSSPTAADETPVNDASFIITPSIADGKFLTLRVFAPKQGDGSIVIMDALGRSMKHITFANQGMSETKIIVDVSNLAPGAWYIHGDYCGMTTGAKFILER